MFVFGILLQIFFATTLVTFGAVLALALIHYGGILLLGAWPLFNIFHISVFLGLNLLATDPATSPRTPAGKLLFGLTWGVAIWCCYVGLRLLELPPYYDKILTVPLVNLMVPLFERAGRAITMSFRFDRAVFIAAYAGLFLLILPTLKLQYRSADYYLQGPPSPDRLSRGLEVHPPGAGEAALYCERHRRACEPWGSRRGDPQLRGVRPRATPPVRRRPGHRPSPESRRTRRPMIGRGTLDSSPVSDPPTP